jgi:hypothetical protein
MYAGVRSVVGTTKLYLPRLSTDLRQSSLSLSFLAGETIKNSAASAAAINTSAQLAGIVAADAAVLPLAILGERSGCE